MSVVVSPGGGGMSVIYVVQINFFAFSTHVHFCLQSKMQRISWQTYFIEIAKLSSVRSPCSRLQVGCVIVKDNRIISMGYNGFLSGCPHRSIIKDNHEQATIHAEMNAISDAARRGVSLCGSVAYITHYPCLNCFKALASSGIKHIVYDKDYRNDEIVSKLNHDQFVKIDKYQAPDVIDLT